MPVLLLEQMQMLQALVVNGYDDWKECGNVRAVHHDGMILFNYTAKAQYEERWNWFERVSRGLILDRITGEIIARPFEKFYNWGEGGRLSDGYIVNIAEKVDGVLGILYRRHGKFHIASRGSFRSEQALWATKYLNDHYDMQKLAVVTPPEATLLFEIICPDHQIVIDYGARQDLVLLAARNRFNGAYYDYNAVKQLAWDMAFSTPINHTNDFSSTTNLIIASDDLPATAEGWVVEFSDGERYKFKGKQYLALHRLVFGLTFSRVLEAVQTNTLDEILRGVPKHFDRFLDQVRRWESLIKSKVIQMRQWHEAAFEQALHATGDDDRKAFAQYVSAVFPAMTHILFLMFDGRDIQEAIYKMITWNEVYEDGGN